MDFTIGKTVENTGCYHCGHEGLVLKERPAENMYGAAYMFLYYECPECGHREISDELVEENARRNDLATREKYDLVSYEDLLKLPRKYGVSREQLNIILDLDDFPEPEDPKHIVIARSVWDEGFPSIDENERIRKALTDPRYFQERLEAAKDKLPEEKYAKAHARVSRMK